MLARARLSTGTFLRLYSAAVTESTPHIRDVLQARVKDAMRSKNTAASTTLRSILAEINAADKGAKAPISSSGIITIIRKAAAKRHDAAVQFTQANRSDLAEKELSEASLLDEFVPPLMSSADIDGIIRDILASIPDEDARKATGKIFKAFYAKVDRSQVDADLVKARVDLAVNRK